MLPHLIDEIKNAAQTIAAPAEEKSSRAERIKFAVLQDANITKLEDFVGAASAALLSSQDARDKIVDQELKHLIAETEGKKNFIPNDPKTVIDAAQAIAADPSYQLMEIDAIKAANAYKNFNDLLKEKYKDAPAATAVLSQDDPASKSRALIGGRVIEIDENEVKMLNQLDSNQFALRQIQEKYVAKKAGELNVVPHDIINVQRALKATAPTEEEYNQQQQQQKQKQTAADVAKADVKGRG